MKKDRYVYEKAEEILDSFAKEKKSAQFRRAYKRLKFIIASYAYSDFKRPENTWEEALAFAWEDAQMAFTGHGEVGFSGIIVQLWMHLSEKEKPEFKKVLTQAFKAAEVATATSTPRRFMLKNRSKPIRTPEEGFDLPYILPVWGPSLREWAVDEGENPDEVEEQFHWFELADRATQLEAEEPAPPKQASTRPLGKGKSFQPKTAKPAFLSLVPNLDIEEDE